MSLSKFQRKNKFGFTLIELLVVISIISLLSSVVFSSLQDARSRGRDSQRLVEMRQVILALEQYYAANGSYPNFGWTSTYDSNWSSGGLATALSPYLPTMPIDPINEFSQGRGNTEGQYNYAYFSGNAFEAEPDISQGYALLFRLENSNAQLESQDGVVICNGDSLDHSHDGQAITWGRSCQ